VPAQCGTDVAAEGVCGSVKITGPGFKKFTKNEQERVFFLFLRMRDAIRAIGMNQVKEIYILLWRHMERGTTWKTSFCTNCR
jgi:hypothetical protein